MDASAALEILNTGLRKSSSWSYGRTPRPPARIPQRRAQSLARCAVLELPLGDVRSVSLDTAELRLSGVYFTVSVSRADVKTCYRCEKDDHVRCRSVLDALALLILM